MQPDPRADHRKGKSRGEYANLSGFTSEQKAARKKAQKETWRKNNSAREKQHARNRHERLKREVFDGYGGVCVCCGETNLHFLTIDHVAGTVPLHHRHPSGNRISGTAFLALLKAANYPDECRILCWNCNCARAYYGFCPHQPHDASEKRYV